MKDFIIGYGKPPIATRFKKGVCANPMGRGRRKPLEAGKIYGNVLAGSVEVSSDEKKLRFDRPEYTLRRLANAAVRGDINSSELLIDIHMKSEANGDFDPKPVIISEAKAFAMELRQRKTKKSRS